MHKPFLLALSALFALSVHAQNYWNYNATDAVISNSNSGYVGIGTSAPRRQLEVKNSLAISPGSSGSVLLLDGTGLPADNGWSNVRLMAGSTGGGGWLKTALDNHGGYFTWEVGTPSGVPRELMRMNANDGNFGIGTTAPETRLDVRGGYITTRNADGVAPAFMQGTSGICYFGSIGTSMVSIGNSTDLRRLNILNNGNVGIGTTDPKYKLAVYGTIGATKVKVTQDNWPDFVFRPGYHLPTLKEVEAFINSHQHLPGIAPAAQVEKDGLDLGDNQAALLRKIEELTLYAIDQDKKIASQQLELKQLDTQVQALRKMVAELDDLKKLTDQLKKSIEAAALVKPH